MTCYTTTKKMSVSLSMKNNRTCDNETVIYWCSNRVEYQDPCQWLQIQSPRQVIIVRFKLRHVNHMILYVKKKG